MNAKQQYFQNIRILCIPDIFQNLSLADQEWVRSSQIDIAKNTNVLNEALAVPIYKKAKYLLENSKPEKKVESSGFIRFQ